MANVVIRERLAAARGFVFDMDGTLVLGDRTGHGLRPLPGALEITQWAARRGRPFVVFTNGTNRTPAAYAQIMRELGFPLPDEAHADAGQQRGPGPAPGRPPAGHAAGRARAGRTAAGGRA